MTAGLFTESDLERASGGRFTHVTMLGQGVTGVVFRARDAHAPDVPWVAVKVSNGAGAPNSALMNEAAALRHPTLSGYTSEWPSQAEPVLCQCYGDLHFAPRVALVMEYFDAQVYTPLDKALEMGHETWTDYQILSILGPFVGLLAQAHAAGYVYADISRGKAGHILWNPATRVVKSYDWGNVVDRRSAADSGAITEVADIVGCGEVLFAMREGPFARLPQNPASYRRPQSPELTALIRRCLDRQAADCLKSAADLEQAMRAFVMAKDEEVARLQQQFDAGSRQFRELRDRAEQDRQVRALQALREQVERINPWSETLTHMNAVHGRDLDTLKLHNTALAAAEELRASVQGTQLDGLALEDVSGYLRSYDTQLTQDPSLPRPPGDRELIGLVAATLAREKPAPNTYLRTFVAGCTEVAPNYADLLDAVLHAQPNLDHTPLRPLVAHLGRQAGIPLLRLQTARCLTRLRDGDLAQLTTHLSQLGDGLETVRRSVQKQADDLTQAVSTASQAWANLQALEGQPIAAVSELPARYDALAQALAALAALDSSGRDEARDLSQVAASHAGLAATAANAYSEGDFSHARQAIQQLKERDRELLVLEQWARDLATLSTVDLAACQKEFGQGSPGSLPTRLRDYLGPQRLGKALTIDPNHDSLRGQQALLADVFQRIWADWEGRGQDKPAMEAALADLLARFVQGLDPISLAELPDALAGREASDVRNFIGSNIVRLVAVQQAVEAASPAANLSVAYQSFGEFVSQVVTASRATTPLVKPIAPLLAPPMAAAALALARRLFHQGQWRQAQAAYNRISGLGDTDPGRLAAVAAERAYADKAIQTLRGWEPQNGAGVVADLSRQANQRNVDAQLTDAVKRVHLDLEEALRNLRAADQSLRAPQTRWEDFFDRLDTCLGCLDTARQAEEKVTLQARFVGKGLRDFETYLRGRNIVLKPSPANGQWVERTRDPYLHQLAKGSADPRERPVHHGLFEPVYQGLAVAAKDALKLKTRSAPVVAVAVASQVAADGPASTPPTEAALSAPSNPAAPPLPRTGVWPWPGDVPPRAIPRGLWDVVTIVSVVVALIVIGGAIGWVAVWALNSGRDRESTPPPTPIVAAVGPTMTVTVGPPSLGVEPLSSAPTPSGPDVGAPTAEARASTPPPTAASAATAQPTTAATRAATPPPGAAGGNLLLCVEDGVDIQPGQAALLCPVLTDAAVAEGMTPRYRVVTPSGDLALRNRGALSSGWTIGLLAQVGP